MNNPAFDKALIHVPNLGYFKVTDVPGDGNCFYSSLAKCPHMRMRSCCEIRNHIFTTINENMTIASNLFYNVAKEVDEFESWLQKKRMPGSWGCSTMALFASWVFGVNIVIVSNALAGFVISNLSEWVGSNIPLDYPVVYLYHHKYLCPFKASICCDHFAYMFPFSGKADDFFIYCLSDLNAFPRIPCNNGFLSNFSVQMIW